MEQFLSNIDLVSLSQLAIIAGVICFVIFGRKRIGESTYAALTSILNIFGAISKNKQHKQYADIVLTVVYELEKLDKKQEDLEETAIQESIKRIIEKMNIEPDEDLIREMVKIFYEQN